MNTKPKAEDQNTGTSIRNLFFIRLQQQLNIQKAVCEKKINKLKRVENNGPLYNFIMSK